MEDFFPKMSLKPNKDCDDYHCRKQQKKFAEEEVERLKNQPEIVEILDATNEIVHEENDWGISLVADDDDVPGMNFHKFQNVVKVLIKFVRYMYLWKIFLLAFFES